MNFSNTIGFRFVSSAILFFILSKCFIVNAQINEHAFKKVLIEIDGEEVFDVRAITQDNQGYIWMITNLGLIRYDGIDGKKYSFDSRSNNLVNRFEILFVDSQGDIWIGASSGLSKYNQDCDCLYKFPAIDYNISLTGIRSITEDKNRNIWVGTSNSELLQYNRKSKTFTRFLDTASDPLRLVNDRIVELLVDQNNNLWIGTIPIGSMKNSGLIRYNINTGKAKQFLHDPSNLNSLKDNRISALYEDKQGQILIGTYMSGFHIYNPENESLNRINFDTTNPSKIHAPYTEEFVNGNDPYVKLIHQDQNGNYWINTTGKGINYFNIKTKKFKNYDFNLVNPQLLWSIYEDRQGSLWIGGVQGSGLFKTDLFARKYTLNTKFTNVQGAYETPLNPEILWILSLQQGLSKMNLKTKEITRYEHNINNDKSIGHNWVRSIYQENKSTLWLGIGNGGAYGMHDGNGGVDRMDIETGEFTHFKLSRNDDELDDFSYTPHSICEDKEGYLWLGAGPGGIFRSDKDKKEFKNLKNDNLSEGVFLNIVRLDSNGDLWASDFADSGTLYLYDRPSDTFKPYLKGYKMYNLLIDEKGWLVISTWEKGLIYLNPKDKSFVQYTKKDGLPSNDGLDIVAGENGIFWIITRNGPAKFDAKTGKISSIKLLKDWYNTRIFKASDGQIYLAANSGLVSFYPDQVLGNPYPPQVSISDLLISDQNYFDGKNRSNELSFSYNKNDIAFKYIGLHFSNSENNSYQYKLEPLDDKWINAGNERTVRFANLSPSTYNFQVKASNSDGVWSDEAASVKFTIKPAWWATWWAYLIYLALAVAFADRFYRFQLSRKLAVTESKRLKEINQVKNTLFTNITHEFRTPLTVIKGMADHIKSNLENKQYDDFENSLEMIDRNSDGLLRLVNEMLDLAKLESGNMELELKQDDVVPFLKYLGESFSSLAEENQISLMIYSEIHSLIMDFDANKLTSVISNLLSNAIKFTPELGKIIVHINCTNKNEKRFLLVKIKDNGIGIPIDELPNIFNRFYQSDSSTIRKSEGTGIGLALTKELIELMRGNIEVNSVIDEGSTFSIRIPVTNTAEFSKNIKPSKAVHTHLSKPLTSLILKVEETNSELPLLLIIEDNMDVAHYLKTCLKNKFETIHAPNGIEGIEMAIEKIPDIIISDVMMPGKDGFEVCGTLKTDERTDHIPIIMLTAKATIEDRLKGLSRGADAYLAKPFVKEELFTRLDQLVAIRKKLISKIQKEGFNTFLNKKTNNPKLQFLQKIVKLIHEDIGDSNFSSEDLAKKLLISESQIYRKIKAITGKSTAVYIRSIRLQFAKELLINTNKTVSEVAYEAGFNDPSWFSRVFKDEFGFSPSSLTK